MWSELVVVLAVLGQAEPGDAGVTALDAGVEVAPLAVIDAGVALESPTTPLDDKRRHVKALPVNEVLQALARVEPQADRVVLCHELRDVAPPALLRVQSVDANDDPVDATVLVDGYEVGPAPFDALVPACATRVEVQRGAETRRETVSLEARGRKTVRVDWGGAKKAWAVSAMTDFSFFSPSLRLVPTGSEPASAVIGAGVRFDSFAKVFHFSVAVNVNPLYGPMFRALLGANLAVVPMVDLFFGASFRPGNSTVRAIITIDAGLWQLVSPAVRAVGGVLLFERVALMLHADLRVMTVGLLFPTLQIPLVSPGLGASAGVAW